MGSFRFRKSIKILPGVRLNINKSSLSLSLGKKGMHYTISSNGTSTKSVGIPGTGLSYVDRDKIGGSGKKASSKPKADTSKEKEEAGTDVNGDGKTDLKDVADVIGGLLK